MDKMLLWGALPWENDGGAVVTYYQLTEMFYRNPKFEFNVIPKVWEQAKQNDLSFAKWHKVKTDFFGQIPKVIPQIMKKNNIKLLVLWHIPWEYFPIIDSVHKIGGQVWNWQTIHWENDVLFFSDKLKDFDHWIPATQYAEDMLIKVGGVDKSKMTMIPHGVPTYKFYPHEYGSLKNFYGVKPDQKLILFVGRCQLTKGIVPLMLAARKLCDEFNCHIMFKAGVHDGVWKAREIGMLLNMMTKWDSRIHFETTWTQPSYMENLMAESDILVCPSGHEGSSLTPLEAMACGRPVAITDIPVHRELLGGNNGVCGLLMPPTDHTEFVNDVQSVKVPSTDIVYGTLKYLLENPDEAKAMGEKGLYRAKELYSLDLICKKWFDLLEKK
jgi:glycosyltransferase involved in cell wall biosynthesis